MRILLVHNQYQYRGGEDTVFKAEGNLLREYGHEVLEFLKTNDSIGKKGSLGVAAGAIWAPDAYREIRQRIRETRPSVVHVHNYMPLISPAVFYAARAEGVPVVQTLHNYRMLCLNGMLMREEKICEECVTKRIKWPGIVHKCYRDSTLGSATVAAMLAVHDAIGTWRNQATRFIVLTQFQRDKLMLAGMPAEKIAVKPNFAQDPGYRPDTARARTGGLFIGRLSHEKGVDVLIGAAKQSPVQISLVGSGPKIEEVKKAATDRLHVTGYISDEELAVLKQQRLFLILPSIVYEGFPMVIPEAFAAGLPIIASRHGGMQELIEDGRTGLHFNPADADDLAAKLRWVAENPDQMRAMGENARKKFEAAYSPKRNHDRLLEIYEEAIEEVSRQGMRASA